MWSQSDLVEGEIFEPPVCDNENNCGSTTSDAEKQ